MARSKRQFNVLYMPCSGRCTLVIPLILKMFAHILKQNSAENKNISFGSAHRHDRHLIYAIQTRYPPVECLKSFAALWWIRRVVRKSPWNHNRGEYARQWILSASWLSDTLGASTKTGNANQNVPHAAKMNDMVVRSIHILTRHLKMKEFGNIPWYQFAPPNCANGVFDKQEKCFDAWRDCALSGGVYWSHLLLQYQAVRRRKQHRNPGLL